MRFHASAQVQHVFRRVVIDAPVFQQHAAECAVGVVLDEIFDDAAALVADFGPIVGARFLHCLDKRLDAQGSALLRVGGGLRGLRRADQAIGRRGGDTHRGCAGEELAPVDLAIAIFVCMHPGCGMDPRRIKSGHVVYSL